MTIDELLSLAGLTTNDEIPVWDAEAVDEPTKKIKAQNLAASVKALAGLVGEAEFTEALADKASAIVDTASGAIASFPDGMAAPAKDIVIGIEPVQAGSGDPSPTNVRPISGWTGAKVTRTGFNVWDEEWESGSLHGGQPITNPDWSRSKNFIPVIPNTAYNFLIEGLSSTNNAYVMFYDGNKNFINYEGIYVEDNIITTPNNCHYIKTQYKRTINSVINYKYCINFSDPTKNGTYEPGHVVTLPISWQSEAGTVYGGTLDVTTGLLTVTMAEVDLGTLTWDSEKTDTYIRWCAPLSGIKQGAARTIQLVCNKYFAITDGRSLNSVPDKSIYGASGTYGVFVQDSTYDNATTADFKAAMSGVQLVYELATPQTYQLTPVEIEMLLGDNNVWADTGDSTVAYRADTKLYIQKINAPTDDDMIADAQIASGKYFIVGGNLYKSTTTIPAGDAINPGSNCILTNLADALNALNT